MWGFDTALQVRIPVHQVWRQQYFWIPSVFEMDNAKNGGALIWRPKRAYVYTQYASNSVFRYLVWVCVCLKKTLHYLSLMAY